MNSYDVFLSYSSKDQTQVHRLARDLRTAELTVWLDEWEIQVGDSIIPRIQHGLEHSRYIALWLTAHAVISGWVQREWQAKYHDEVSNNRVALLPLLAEDCEIPILLRDRKYADFRHNYGQGLAALLAVFGKQAGVTESALKTGASDSTSYFEDHTANTQLIYVDAVDSIEKHGAMWRWDQRMFHYRHPRAYLKFDLVGLELGRSWWRKYPEQDWVLRDWTHEQIGQYCLCPIKESIFSALMSGDKRETDLSPNDIVSSMRIHAHKYWYLSNFVRAKVRPGIRPEVAEFASNIMIQHALSRAINSEHFATNVNKEISIVTFVEAKSLENFAEKHRFVKGHPHCNDDIIRKIHYAVWERKQLEVKRNNIEVLLSKSRKVIREYKNQLQVVFQQPPNY